MNKKKIGKYLELLRKDNNYSKKEIANLLSTTEKSVNDWERKEVLPPAKTLYELAKLYKSTVDDILECGQRLTTEKLYQKYLVFKKPPFGEKIDPNYDYYTPYHKGINIAKKRLKQLIYLFYDRALSRNEDVELCFLFEHMCDFTDYFEETYEGDCDQDNYSIFIDLINSIKAESNSKNEYYYEIQKNIKISINGFNNPFPEYGDPNKDVFKDEQFKLLEPWEKDAYLSLIQTSDVIFKPDTTEYRLKNYEEEYGKEFDKETVIKDLIKYFINNGAVLNPVFLAHIETITKEIDVLETLEDVYVNYKKPILISFYKNIENSDELEYGYISNNSYSRFLCNYYDYLTPLYKDESNTPKELYELLHDNDEEKLVNILYKNRHRTNDANVEKDIKYKKANISPDLEWFNSCKEKVLNDEMRANKCKSKVHVLEQKLESGYRVDYEIEKEDISQENDFNHFEKIIEWKNNLSYKDFLASRDHVRTKQLMEEIDLLSLKEIREKYFPKVVTKHE